MNKKTTIIIIISIVTAAIVIIYVASLIDMRKIITQADVESTVQASDLADIPSPDQSIISNFFTKLLNVFTGK